LVQPAAVSFPLAVQDSGDFRGSPHLGLGVLLDLQIHHFFNQFYQALGIHRRFSRRIKQVAGHFARFSNARVAAYLFLLVASLAGRRFVFVEDLRAGFDLGDFHLVVALAAFRRLAVF